MLGGRRDVVIVSVLAAAPAAKQQAALEAARACRMWTEIATAALKIAPLTQAQAAPYDTKSAAIATVANAASTADPTWNTLATDVAGANDFASVALPDIDTRITTDCQRRARVGADDRGRRTGPVLHHEHDTVSLPVEDDLAIRRVVLRYCRGDRPDGPGARAVCYHPDATDSHGSFTGGVEEFLTWVWRLLGRYTMTMHYVANQLVEPLGDRTGRGASPTASPCTAPRVGRRGGT